jgi:hypothetical protein
MRRTCLGALLAPVFMFPFDAFTPDVAVDHEIDLADRGFPELHVVPVEAGSGASWQMQRGYRPSSRSGSVRRATHSNKAE